MSRKEAKFLRYAKNSDYCIVDLIQRKSAFYRPAPRCHKTAPKTIAEASNRYLGSSSGFIAPISIYKHGTALNYYRFVWTFSIRLNY